jgi:membrane protein YdbS with pleckstrin-like domain
MNKLPKEKRDKIILIALGTVVACVAVWLLVINMQRTALRNVREQVTKSREQLARGEATLKAQAQVNQEFEEVSMALKQRETAMAAPNDMYSWLIQTLNGFRSGYKVEIPQFGREIPAEVGCFPKFPYRAAVFNLRGSAYYHDFGRFLADFENTFPNIRVQNVELEPLGEVDAREKLGFRVELLTLVRPISP